MDFKAFPDAPPENIVDLLERLSILMAQMQARDVRLQTTISEISKERTLASDEIEALQYLDLSTQIHGDLQRFLSTLSRELDEATVDFGRLAEALNLGSLKRSLLSCVDGTPPNLNGDAEEILLL